MTEQNSIKVGVVQFDVKLGVRCNVNSKLCSGIHIDQIMTINLAKTKIENVTTRLSKSF